jgi:hypothetical protein
MVSASDASSCAAEHHRHFRLMVPDSAETWAIVGTHADGQAVDTWGLDLYPKDVTRKT